MAPTVGIATITLARSEKEAGKLRTSLSVLSALGLPVFIADGGSPAPFVLQLERMPNVRVRTGVRGLVPQVKASVADAVKANADLVVYTESDKQEFFGSGISGLIDRALQDPRPAVVFASRDPEAMATFPRGQQTIEESFSAMAGEFLGFRADLLYGPLVLHREVANAVLPAAGDDLGWGWRPYLMARTVRSGGTVVAHQGPFACPHDQRDEDDEQARLYRLRQLIDNVRGLHSGLAKG